MGWQVRKFVEGISKKCDSNWKGTIEQFGPSQSDEFVYGRSSLGIIGSIRGEVQGVKKGNLVYAPLDSNRLFERHLTRNDSHPQERELLRAFNLITSTIQFGKYSWRLCPHYQKLLPIEAPSLNRSLILSGGRVHSIDRNSILPAISRLFYFLIEFAFL